jgi:hypothetical protein
MGKVRRGEKVAEVEVGQVWEDCDRRACGRRLRVEAVFEDLEQVGCRVERTGKLTTISISRMKPGSTGYRLVG